MEADVVSLRSQDVSFGMHVASTLAPWGTIERSWGTWKHKKGGFGVHAWISTDFERTSGLHFEIILPTLEQDLRFFQVTF